MPFIPHHRRTISVLCFALYVLLGAVLLLRPHQETFIGLDNSFIRMMTHSMAQGRDQVGIDQTLIQVPHELRRHFLYNQDPGTRLTLDRTFQIDNLDVCRYRPFFYPVFSYAAMAFNSIVPGQTLDYFLPTLSLVFFILAGWFMLAKARLPGLFAGLGLLLSLPLLPWFGRGYYPELCALLVIFITALHWLSADRVYRYFIPASFFLGLAICFHPLIALWSGVLFLLMALDETRKSHGIFLAFLAFLLGMLPLVFINNWITQPYGDLFSYQWLKIVFLSSTTYFLFIIAAFFACCCAAVLLLERGRALLRTLFFSPGNGSHAFRLCLAVIPTTLLLLFEKTKTVTLVGLADLWSLLNSPYGLVVAATILVSQHPAVRPRSRALLCMTIVLASVFLYLKGTEPFGLWSQRRLLPITIPFLVASLSVWREVLFSWTSLLWKQCLVVAGLFLAAVVMIFQHPHFYLLRSENHADAITEEVLKITDGALTIFDYHHYGSPFVALNEVNALILYDHISLEGREEVVRWAQTEARKRPVIWVTVYHNPGLEHAMRLEAVHRIKQTLPRLLAKKSLPAVLNDLHLDMTFLRIKPLVSSQPPPLDKVLDKGSLALRGPWGRSDITLRAPDGRQLPARWTREGSAVIGPVPRPGEQLFVELTAGAYRGGDIDHQVLRIIPPWDGPALELRVNNPHTLVQGVLTRPVEAAGLSAQTGRYTFSAAYPYDPALQGIKGFAPDLGVLLHRIRMQVQSQEANPLSGDDAQ